MTFRAYRASVVSSPELAQELRRQMEANPHGSEVKLLVAFSSPRCPLEEVVAVLSAMHSDAVVLGCSSAGEFTEEGESSGSVSVFALSGDFQVSGGIGKNLRGDVEGCVQAACASLHDIDAAVPHHTALLLADGLAFVGEEAALLAAINLGPSVAIAGASAADDLALNRTTVAVGGQVASDAVAIALISSETPISIGVAHGHQPLGPEATVTRSTGNVVHEIDGRPAWEAYRAATSKAASGLQNLDFDDPTHFLSYMARFEVGLSIEGGFKVRAALMKEDDDSLSFVCQIPEGTHFAYMGSDRAGQITSARRAAQMARDGLPGGVAGVLVFECACRKIILQEQFDDAVRAIADVFPGVPLAGAETYGEVALHSGSLSAYHNSTTVVVAFGQDRGR